MWREEGKSDVTRDPGSPEGRSYPPGVSTHSAAGPVRNAAAARLSRDTTSSHPTKGLLPPCSANGGTHGPALPARQGHVCRHFRRGVLFIVTSWDLKPAVRLSAT